MAFSESKWGKVDSAAAPLYMKIFTYVDTTTDTLATIKGSGFFNPIYLILRKYDVIFAVGTDGATMLTVTSNSYASTVTTDEYLSLTQNQIFVGDANGRAADVAMSGDATIVSNGTLTIGAGKVTQAKIEEASLNNTVVATMVTPNTTGAITSTFTIETTPNTTSDNDVVMNHKVLILDVHAVPVIAPGTAGDTIQIKNGSTAITNVMNGNVAPNTIIRPTTMDFLNNTIVAGGTLRASVVDGGGGDVPPYLVVVTAVRVS